MADAPVKGKFKIAVIGKPKKGTSKSTGKPYTIHELQFEQDPNWYSTFWNRDTEPVVGEELEGTKSWDDSYQEGNWKFEMERQGFKGGSFNPASANATIYAAAANIAHNWLSIDPENYKKWLAAKPEGTDPFVYYIDTIGKIAGAGKEAVTKMGAAPKAPESQENSSAPKEPSAPSQPINSVSPLPGNDEIDLDSLMP